MLTSLSTLWSTIDRTAASSSQFVPVLPKVTISNNILVGRAEIDAKAQAVVKSNVQARASDFADPSKFDYRLRIGSKLAGTAGPAGSFGKEDRPASDYRHVAGSDELAGLTELTPLSPGAFQRLAR